MTTTIKKPRTLVKDSVSKTLQETADELVAADPLAQALERERQALATVRNPLLWEAASPLVEPHARGRLVRGDTLEGNITVYEGSGAREPSGVLEMRVSLSESAGLLDTLHLRLRKPDGSVITQGPPPLLNAPKGTREIDLNTVTVGREETPLFSRIASGFNDLLAEGGLDAGGKLLPENVKAMVGSDFESKVHVSGSPEKPAVAYIPIKTEVKAKLRPNEDEITRRLGGPFSIKWGGHSVTFRTEEHEQSILTLHTHPAGTQLALPNFREDGWQEKELERWWDRKRGGTAMLSQGDRDNADARGVPIVSAVPTASLDSEGKLRMIDRVEYTGTLYSPDTGSIHRFAVVREAGKRSVSVLNPDDPDERQRILDALNSPRSGSYQGRAMARSR